MHTDEYEISIGREVTLCRKLIKSLGNEISGFEKRYGMDTQTFLQGFETGKLSGNDEDSSNWRKALRELQFWKKTLDEYEGALAGLKGE